MLFEKIVADDREMHEHRVAYSIYCRIKILTPEGRSFGDITLPYFDKTEKIEELRARTVLPTGAEMAVSKAQVFESEVLRAGGIRLRQKAFSLPGITAGSIIEY